MRRIEQDMLPALPAAGEAEAFQRWRVEMFKRYSKKPDTVLEARLALLQTRIAPEIWRLRYRLTPGVCRSEAEWRDVCEAVILEYLLGLYPPERGQA
jgi:hypothetical protein